MNQFAFYINRNIRPPLSLEPWLQHQSSLTEKLRSVVGDVFLDILNQAWVSVGWWERYALDLGPQEIFQREIVMSALQIPCWYARTIIPQLTYKANEFFFKRLKHESLGEIIFSEERIQRSTMISYVIDSESIEYHWVAPKLSNKATFLWARLSLFTIDNEYTFYLIEILLPGLEEILNKNNRL